MHPVHDEGDGGDGDDGSWSHHWREEWLNAVDFVQLEAVAIVAAGDGEVDDDGCALEVDRSYSSSGGCRCFQLESLKGTEQNDEDLGLLLLGPERPIAVRDSLDSQPVSMVAGQRNRAGYCSADAGVGKKILRQDLRTKSSVPDPCSFFEFFFGITFSVVLVFGLDTQKIIYLDSVTLISFNDQTLIWSGLRSIKNLLSVKREKG